MMWLLLLAALLAAAPAAAQSTTAGRTSITCGNGVACTPSTITGTGMISGAGSVAMLGTTASHVVTLAEWANGAVFVATVSGAGVTLPTATSASVNGGITLVVQPGATMVVTPTGTDQINSGGAATAVTLSANIAAPVTTSGTTGINAFVMPLNPSGSGNVSTNAANAYVSPSVNTYGSGVEIVGPSSTKTTAYTLSAADCGSTILYNSGSAANITLFATAPVNCTVVIVQQGVGQATVVNSGTTLNSVNSYTKTKGQWAAIGLTAVSATVWVLSGDGA
jgi:hypothetical protein